MFNSDKCECAASCYHECMCDWVVKKEWQGLSDDEIIEKYIPIWGVMINARDRDETIDFARAIEAKLKEKNNV